jgi:hypothetical protein
VGETTVLLFLEVRCCCADLQEETATFPAEALEKSVHAGVLVIMIRFILLQNRQGKTRLAKYYIPLEDSEKHKLEFEVHRLVVNRDAKFTNFVEVSFSSSSSSSFFCSVWAIQQ